MDRRSQREELDARAEYTQYIADNDRDNQYAAPCAVACVGAWVHNEMGDERARDRLDEHGKMTALSYEAGLGDLDAPNEEFVSWSDAQKQWEGHIKTLIKRKKG